MGATSEYFRDHELRCHGRNCCGRENGCQPELLNALEDFRSALSAHLGRETPVIINSAYRCSEHNKAVGGTPNSLHVQGLAADVRAVGVSAATLEEVARSLPTIKGIGRDDHSRYIHIDVRSSKATWCYDRTGKVISHYKAGTVA